MIKFAKMALAPGVRLMQRLQMPTKMLMMGLALLVPLILLAINGMQAVRADLDLARSEAAGAQAVGHLMQVVRPLQDHRDLTSRVLFGDAAATAARDEARGRLKATVAAMDQAVALGLPFQLQDLWNSEREAVLALAEGRHAQGRSQAFAEHGLAVERLRSLVLAVGERSGLLLDPEAGTYFLMDLVVQQAIPWAEALAFNRGQGAGLLTRGDANSVERAQVMGRLDAIGTALDNAEFRVQALGRTGLAVPSPWAEAVKHSRAFQAKARDTFTAEAISGDAGQFFGHGSDAIASVFAFESQANEQLRHALAEREARLTGRMWVQLCASTLGILLVIYLGIALYSSFNGALRRLERGVVAVAGGDLAHQFHIKGRDELARMGKTIEAMSDRLSSMVADIRSNAVRVSIAGQQLSSGGEALSQRTEEQTSNLQQTAATVGQLSTAVTANAGAAQELDALTIRLREQAETGGLAMRETVQAMATLESSSRKVAEIISVIDGIAFQTNILALNAAVEAARAGESGRGFAVVASEVRQLAQRSSAAAAEIRTLISQSAEQVDLSVGRIQHTNGTLDAVVSGVRDVSGRLRGIAQASAQQSRSLEQVSRSVDSLGEITRQNASMVVDSARASLELVERASKLGHAVGQIRLRQGGADEARALVDRAVALIQAKGLHAAAQQFRAAQGGFLDRDLYIFVTDRVGRYHVHGAKPGLEGSLVHDVPGIDGDRFARESWEATSGSHWVEYAIVNQQTGKVQPKASYVVAISDRLLVGCGIYTMHDQTTPA